MILFLILFDLQKGYVPYFRVSNYNFGVALQILSRYIVGFISVILICFKSKGFFSIVIVTDTYLYLVSMKKLHDNIEYLRQPILYIKPVQYLYSLILRGRT